MIVHNSSILRDTRHESLVGNLWLCGRLKNLHNDVHDLRATMWKQDRGNSHVSLLTLRCYIDVNVFKM